MSLPDAIDYGMKFAQSEGASQCEGFGTNIKQVALEVEKGRPLVTNGIDRGCSFRTIYENNLGFAFTKRLTRDSIQEAIRTAIGISRVRGSDKVQLTFAGPKKSSIEAPVVDPKIWNIQTSDIGDFYSQLKDPCESSNLNFLGAQIQSVSGSMLLKNTCGVETELKLGFIGGGAFLLSTRGLIPSWGFEIEVNRSYDKLDWIKLGNKCVSEVKRNEAPKTLNYTREVPVILEAGALGGMFGGILTVLGQMLYGNSAYRGETYFADRVGDQVAVENFSFYDNPIDVRSIFYSAYDMEGVPSTNLPLIEDGILKNFLLDNYFAQKMGAESNGKCTRLTSKIEPITTPPSIGTSTIVVKPGDSSLEEMIAETAEGFSINTVMGVHMSDKASGRFAVTGSGHFIKNGEIQYAVQDISISGEIPELLLNIDMIGKEQKVSLASIIPPMRISKLNVSAQKMDSKTLVMLRMLKIATKLRLMKNPLVAD